MAENIRTARFARAFNPSRATTTRFAAECPARQAYLLLSDQSGTPLTLTQLNPVGGKRWNLTLALKPGRYRYRYYANLGKVTTYVSPADAESMCVPMEGLDALLVVPKTSR